MNIAAFALAAVAVTLPLPARSVPPRAQIDVLRYEVLTSVDLDAKQIRGETTIHFRTRSAGGRELLFSGNALTLTSVQMDGKPLTPEARDGMLAIPLPRSLRKGERARLTVTYAGRPARGLMFEDGRAYSGYFTCDWMICALDDLGDKASIDLSLEGPAGMTSHGPGQLRGKAVLADGRERHLWREKRPYSPYLFGFALGDFVQATDRVGATELIYLAGSGGPERLETLFEPTADMLRFFEAKAGVRFPHPRYVQVLTPGSEAQEGANFALIGEKLLARRLGDPQDDWVIAHELAHQWWGNSITCSDLSQFWLNEGVTTFMVAAWKEHRWGRAAYDRELNLLRRRVNDARQAGLDHPLTYAGPYPSLSARRAIQYSKGALFLDELRKALGDEAFWRGLRAYTRSHQGKVVNSQDFQRSFERATGRDLSPLFREWVYESPPST